MRKVQCAVIAALLATACGGHNPTAPTQAAPGATGLTIAGADERLSGFVREIRWEANLAGNAMVGHFQENLRSVVFRIGTARMEYELTTMTHPFGPWDYATGKPR